MAPSLRTISNTATSNCSVNLLSLSQGRPDVDSADETPNKMELAEPEEPEYTAVQQSQSAPELSSSPTPNSAQLAHSQSCSQVSTKGGQPSETAHAVPSEIDIVCQ